MKKTTIIISPKESGWLTLEQAKLIQEKVEDRIDSDRFSVLVCSIPINVNAVGDDRINHVQINVDDLEQIIKRK